MSEPAELQRFRKEFPERVVRAGGLRWGVIDSAPRTAGHSPPALLLLPGTMGTGEIYWQQFRALAGRLRLIAVSYPAVADVARYADGAVRILRQRGIARASVLGSSLGGFTAQTIALRHPQVVETLFIGNSLCDPRTSWRPKHPPLAEIEATPAATIRDDRVARTDQWPRGDPGLALAQAVIGAQGRTRISARHLKARVLALLRAEDLPPLPIPDSRIVIIDCDDDPIMPPPVRKAVRARYPGAEAHALPSGGHFPYISRAEQYTAIIGRRLLG
ncbi:MAG: alpha/beta hydrolase [SAR324 cluster bacterium]|nr:alpha/beta hydrolase [SAR324 cluster bacterium]